MWRLAVAYYWGFRDGWEQPYELLFSRNLEHLTSERHDLLTVMEVQDRGINLGQSLRGGRRSQADTEGLVPFGLRWRYVNALVLLALGVVGGWTMLTHGVDGRVLVIATASLPPLINVLAGPPREVRHER